MDILLKKLNDYSRLDGCKLVYELQNGIKLDVSYRLENFPHLLGLHKLDDILLIHFWLDRHNKTVKLPSILKAIRNGSLTDTIVRSSSFFHLIKDRYESFSYNNLTTLNYTDAIIDFNASVIHSKLKSDYILFEERPSSEYNHMAIALDKKQNRRYVETFFHESSTSYITGQTIVPIKKLTIYNPDGSVLISDQFP